MIARDLIAVLIAIPVLLGCCCPVISTPRQSSEPSLPPEQPVGRTGVGTSKPIEQLVQITDVRIVPWTTPSGASVQMVLTSWRNTSGRPIGALYADIVPYDRFGKKIGSGADDYCIFAASNNSQLINGGFVYKEPYGDGFVLLSNLYGTAYSVEVTPTRIEETTLKDLGF